MTAHETASTQAAPAARLPLFRRLDWRLALIQTGTLATFALIPLWYRVSVRYPPPFLLTNLYVSYFLILYPMLLTIGCWLIFGLPGLRALLRDPVRRVWALVTLLLALWTCASTLWAFMQRDHPEVGGSAAVQFAVVLLFAVAAACAGPPPRVVLAVVVVGLVFNSFVTVLQMQTQASIGLRVFGEFPLVFSRPGISVVQAGDMRLLRPYGLTLHPNVLAGTLMLGVLACGACLLSRRAPTRWVATLVLPFGVYALLLTFSRAAWLGAAAGGFAVLPLLRIPLRRPAVRRHLALAGALVALAGVLFVAGYRPFLSARAGQGSESVELRSISDRLVFTEFALRSITETPVFGVGIGNFPWRSSYMLITTNYDLRGEAVHHVLLAAWAELGIVGFALVVLALILGVEAALRAVRAEPDAGARIGLLAIVIAFAVVGLLDHYPWTITHIQTAWWACLALASRPTGASL